ncbi:hypothetical protein HLRTI_001832 [Halorhabdus tiamatea SARL4B]|uniref:Uncharacterized protein n=1 Tax=Halorhabdus tiamatea SARL4B TaxID=1033806 RepID=F7PQG7_9EURY|nr:hypothetical protein [Halorhabdus tiamatea]ERJ06069.1 hypothetical protein HLRTI_001832 [Halorhabdus tiamatea SARL4B]CCQ33301.1 hypothetical protein HTIA_1163 [Halorhabdus tiamatea SARL4B]
MTEHAIDHLRQLDHWAFLVALALAAIDAVRTRRRRPAVVTGFLTVALVYDAYEFMQKDG